MTGCFPTNLDGSFLELLMVVLEEEWMVCDRRVGKDCDRGAVGNCDRGCTLCLCLYISTATAVNLEPSTFVAS
jgi:hypothetical protein